MTPRGSLTLCLTLLMGAAPLHCLAHVGESARHHMQVVERVARHEPVPANPEPEPCDNESGCICRGAVLADHVDASGVAPQGLEMFFELPTPLAIEQVVLQPLDCNHLLSAHRPAPLSGKMLRARLASFVI